MRHRAASLVVAALGVASVSTALWPEPTATAPAQAPRAVVAPARPAEAALASTPAAARSIEPLPEGWDEATPQERAEWVAFEAARDRVDGVLLFDGVPRPGGVVTFVRLDAEGRPTLTLVVARAGEAGRFSVDLPAGWWGLRSDPTWPSDAVRVGEIDRDEPFEEALIVRADWVWLRGPASEQEAPERVDDRTRLSEPTLELRGQNLERVLCLDVRSPWFARGRVVDDATGEPVVDARVVASREGDARFFAVEAPVGVGGEFSVMLPAWLARENVAVIARAPGRAPAGALVEVGVADDGSLCWSPERPDDADDEDERPVIAWRDAPPLVLRLPTGSLTLRGRVTDLDDRPLAGAEVFVRMSLPGRTDRTVDDILVLATDVRGEFRLDDVAPGAGQEHVGPACAQLDVGARTEGYRYAEVEHIVDATAPPLHLRLSRTVRLAGVVLDADGRPIQASVWTPGGCTGDDVPVGPDGRFAREGAREELELHVTAEGHLPRSVLCRGPGEVVIRLVRAAPPIRGRVVGGAGQVSVELPRAARPARPRPGPDEVVDLPREGLPDFTEVEPDGTFVVRRLPPDVTDVLLSAGGERVRAAPGDTGVVLTAPPRRPPARREVTLRLVAAESGEPLRGRCDGTSVPPEGARLRLEGPDEELAELSIEAPGRIPTTHRLADHLIVDGDTIHLGAVPLERAGAVEVRFRTWPASPVHLVLARWLEGGQERSEAEDPPRRANDAWTRDTVVPGRVFLTLGVVCHAGGHGCVDKEHLAPPIEVDVRAGETTRVEVDLSRLTPPLR